MKAAVVTEFGTSQALQIREVPDPVAGPGEVVVRVKACGLNRLDILLRSGKLPGKIPLPHISGSEIAGLVHAVGPGVTTAKAGERVAVAPYLFCGSCESCLAGEETTCLRGDIIGLMSDGGFAEYVKVPASSLVSLPEGVSFVDAAATALAAVTSWHMLVTRARMKPGETVLVLAAGSGVGSAAIQIAKLAGARVIATAGTAEKMDLARRLGADSVINHRTSSIKQEIRTLTNKRGVDLVFEHVGAATFEDSVACLARNGRLVTCGALTGNTTTLDIWGLFAKQITLIGSYGGTRGELRTLLGLVAAGKYRPVVHKTYPLEQLGQAQDDLEASEQFGKLVAVVE